MTWDHGSMKHVAEHLVSSKPSANYSRHCWCSQQLENRILWVAFLINNIYMTSYQKDNKMKFMPHDGWAAHNFVFLWWFRIYLKTSPSFQYMMNNTNCLCILIIIRPILIICGSWMYTRDSLDQEEVWFTLGDLCRPMTLLRDASWVWVYLQGRTNLISEKC